MPIHPLWIAAILVIVLIVFGPGRLPELGGAVGKAMREFRKATSELTNEVTASVQAPPPAPQAPQAPVAPMAPPVATTTESAPAKGPTSEATTPPN
jgi:sec-independent protein translocase protein TatA